VKYSPVHQRKSNRASMEVYFPFLCSDPYQNPHWNSYKFCQVKRMIRSLGSVMLSTHSQTFNRQENPVTLFEPGY